MRNYPPHHHTHTHTNGHQEFTADEKKKLQFLYDEWAHPYFISIEEYERLCGKTGQLTAISGANWVKVSLLYM